MPIIGYTINMQFFINALNKSFLLITALALVSCAHTSSSNNSADAKEAEKAKIYLQLAVDQYSQRQFSKSLESVLNAIQLDPKLSPAFNHLGLVYMETKRFPKAEEAFKKALALNPNYPEVLNNIGVMLNRQDRFMEAISYFEKALSSERYVTPENAYTNMGTSYFKLGNTLRAKSNHQKALDLAPDFCLAQKNLGDVYAKEKNYSKAAEYFEKSTTNCPLFDESQYKLGLALMKLGKRKVAKTQFENLIEKHKNGPYVDRSNEVLKYLQ